ncbi:hypothetical protein DL98DRAFT_223723 [Cadophora sp. DSE1049]|nr:hypothetical protein DL98DRAFT_223723 [Cadophora sp. DSE1049]
MRELFTSNTMDGHFLHFPGSILIVQFTSPFSLNFQRQLLFQFLLNRLPFIEGDSEILSMCCPEFLSFQSLVLMGRACR